MSVRGNYQPQQSVLNPQFGQRHTACILNISTLQRSQRTASGRGFDDGVVSRGSRADPAPAVGVCIT
ncbi:MAG TPA: hypothetical protein VN700_06365 [Vicinamibacterales bacterium]|nr:hypothetical protein [Vicinamibacterales bacterium]